MFDTEKFQSINYGTNPTTVNTSKIIVDLNTSVMVDDYAKAFVNELQRRNPIRAKEVDLTVDEMQAYLSGLLAIRVKFVNQGTIDCWRKAKALLIPRFYEFVLTQVGAVIDNDRGFIILPAFDYDYDIDSMLNTSDKLRAFITDGVDLAKDAFPRDDSGDPETMTMCIVENYVVSMSRIAHPINSYVASFVGMKLREEAAFKMLYRIRYDDVDFIRSMLLREGTLYG